VSASSQPVAERVIATTKLHVPAVRDGLVSRDSLVRHLAAGAVSKLTLLDAPAGSGKTTLLAEWSAFGGERPFAWLTLDEEDNDPVRFWDCETREVVLREIERLPPPSAR
jgi:ATP/maltotriose-dependent transcriptional regulator MalT